MNCSKRRMRPWREFDAEIGVSISSLQALGSGAGKRELTDHSCHHGDIVLVIVEIEMHHVRRVVVGNILECLADWCQGETHFDGDSYEKGDDKGGENTFDGNRQS